jgi:proteasome accessory factor B
MPDAPSRVERVLNLLALLLDTRVPLTREEIVRELSGYPPQISAYRRAFERDKEVLRGMGVPITMEQVGDAGEVGYRVRPDDYYLPDLGLSAEETAALRVAVSAISLGSSAGEGALMKLGGMAEHAPAPIASLPIAPALATLFEAFRNHAVVTFTHRGQTRTVEPWGLSSKRGQWYLVGYDRDRQAMRAFRADRIDGDVKVGEPDAFETPDDFRPDDHIEDRAWLMGDEPPVIVRVAAEPGYADRIVDELGADGIAEELDDGRLVVEIPVSNRVAFRSIVLAYREHAEVLAPDDVRADLIAWLRRFVSGQGDAA